MKKLSHKQFLNKARDIHRNKFKYSKYINSREKISITCNDCGLIFKQKANNHLNGQGCPRCCGYIFPLSQEQFIEKAKVIHGNKYNYDDFVYKNNRTKGIIKCNKCGIDFLQRAAAHLQGQGCPNCKSSLGERIIKDILDKYKINYIQEYRIPNQIYRFEYDFYLPTYNLLIEFHGIQHYQPVQFFGGENTFKEVQRRDMFKRELAKLLNIPLIEFNYRHIKHMSEEEFENFVINNVRVVLKRRK